MEFAQSLSRKDRRAFLLYAAGIEQRKNWDRMDGERIKAFVGVLKDSLQHVQESVSA